jgi:hypothetical protein
LASDDKVLRRVQALARMQATLSQKLRLSVQSSIRLRTAQNAEGSEPASPERPDLLGGRAAWKDWPN